MSHQTPSADQTQATRALALFATRPLMRASELSQLGIARETLRRLVILGALDQPGRGLYRRTDAKLSANMSLAEVARRTPHAVVALTSALRFHGLTTQLPHEVWVYIDRKARPPAHPPVALRIFRTNVQGLTDGVHVHTIDGVPVFITGVSRTIVDCFRRRNEVGLDVAIEALRDANRLKKLDVDEVWRIAQRRRALNLMRPYIECIG